MSYRYTEKHEHTCDVCDHTCDTTRVTKERLPDSWWRIGTKFAMGDEPPEWFSICKSCYGDFLRWREGK